MSLQNIGSLRKRSPDKSRSAKNLIIPSDSIVRLPVRFTLLVTQPRVSPTSKTKTIFSSIHSHLASIRFITEFPRWLSFLKTRSNEYLH